MTVESFHVKLEDFVKDSTREDICSGYGCVSFYIQKETGLKCVGKRTNASLFDEKIKRSFDREVEALANCHHPTIVPFVGFAEVNHFGHIFLEEIKNGSLESFLQHVRKGDKGYTLTDTDKFIISYGVAISMEYLHGEERIHRDLKTANILLDDHLYPLLTDFGTSKPLDNSVKVNQTTPQTTAMIMAPEFIEDPANFSNSLPIDVYSYAITIYELWTLQPPFSHLKGPFQIMNAVVEGQRPGIPISLPDPWKKLIVKCWDNNPEARYKFDEIVDELETGKYYTPEMDQDLIDQYKNYLFSTNTTSPRSIKFRKSSGKIPSEKVSSEKVESSEKVKTENPILTKMRQDADAGDPTAQFNYIIALFEGTYDEPNYQESLKYADSYYKREDAFSDANKANSAIIEFYAAKCYAQLKDYDMATQKSKHSIQHGNTEAAFFLAELMFAGHVHYRPEQILNYYRIAANNGKGIPEAVKKYAYICYYGSINNSPNKKEAIKYFELGSNQGDPEMMYMWAIRNEYGRGIDKNTEVAMDLMKLSADRGYTPAMVDYGLHLLNGIIVPKNENEAKVRFQSAASQNDPWGQLWYYVMCKNDDELDEKITENLMKSLNSNSVPEAWAVYGRELVEQGSVDDALPSLFFACQNGSFNGFLCLGNICEEDSKYGDQHFFYEMASNYCHCLDDCGFSTPIRYNVFHCCDCDIDMCEGCAKHCHKDHDIREIGPQIGFKCQCGKNGFKDKCSGEFVGKSRGYQHLYQCTTCCIKSDTKYICKTCAEKCHKGHQIIDCGVMRDFCSCGMHELPYNFNCHLLKFENSKVCTEKKMKQRWFQCISCGLYGPEEVGVCKACRSICHEGHTCIDLGVKECACCCKNANCFLQND